MADPDHVIKGNQSIIVDTTADDESSSRKGAPNGDFDMIPKCMQRNPPLTDRETERASVNGDLPEEEEEEEERSSTIHKCKTITYLMSLEEFGELEYVKSNLAAQKSSTRFE
jgi:hypothetical protein